MKKDRNCGCGMNPYPVYPTYPVNNMMTNMSMPMMNQYPMTQQSNMMINSNVEQQINNLEQQINLLDRRITRLENSVNMSNNDYQTNSSYSDSNYHMM